MTEENVMKSWGYMKHMKILLKSFLDDYLRAFYSNPDTNVSIFCMTRELSGYISVESDWLDLKSFDSLARIAECARETSKIKNLHQSHPLAEERLEAKKKYQSYCDAIVQICKSGDYEDKYSFEVIGPMETDVFYVFPIIGVQTCIINQQLHLKTKYIENTTLKMSDCYFSSALEALFSFIVSQKIYDNYPWRSDVNIIDKLYVEAARNYMARVGAYARPFCEVNVFDNIVKISSLAYERKEKKAKIIFGPEGSMNIIVDIRFKFPVRIEEHRKVRKLLEVTSDNVFLVSDGSRFLGFGRFASNYDWDDEKIFIVEVVRKSFWRLYSNAACVLAYDTGKVIPPKRDDYSPVVMDLIERSLGVNDQNKIAIIHEIINKIRQDDHGAILVFSENAKLESERLLKDGVPADPFSATNDNISLLTSIDGAVLLDVSCKCYSFGVILDGISTDAADSSRGSRYNSSVRYFESNKEMHKMLIVVKSEDGMIDIIPNLKPKASRSLISGLVDQLVGVTSGDNFQYDLYRGVINELDKKRFYLNADECGKINKCVEVAEKIMENDPTISIKFQYSKFVGNDKLSEYAYFFDD